MRYHVENELFPMTFPELIRPRVQLLCKFGHPLAEPLRPHIFNGVQPKVAQWGSGNRICLNCQVFKTEHRDTYSRHSGIHGRAYRGLPERPAFRERHLIGDLAASEHGFKVTENP